MSKDQFYQLFLDQLFEIYSAENLLLKALPEMADAATTPQLTETFQQLLKESRNQIARLEQIFEQLNVKFNGVTCEAMQGLINEIEGVLNKYDSSLVRDAALITFAQRIEHYEMAVFGTLRTFARHLDYDDIAKLLQESLNEVGKGNKTLTSIAEGGVFLSGINVKAIQQ